MFGAFVLLCTFVRPAKADDNIVVRQAHSQEGFEFANIPLPAINDAGANAKWSIAAGRLDANSGQLNVLSDGQVPSQEDSPRENVFFASGSTGGVIIADLGEARELIEVVTYSWHAGSRAPQVYRLYVATGLVKDFSSTDIDQTNPTEGGWKLLSEVDTRQVGPMRGQHAAATLGKDSGLGKWRFVRLDVLPVDTKDPFAQTFFSEIDVLTKSEEDVKRLPKVERQLHHFASSDGKYKYVLDTTEAPDLAEWSQEKLQPVIETWYPKIVTLFPSENFSAPREVSFRFLASDKMRGIPAWAQGSTISMNTGWFRGELEREARGAVVHEMVHIVQQYQAMNKRSRPNRQTPGWLVEGIPDYVRWFLYEPESKGAVLKQPALSKARHDASYRVSANFIHYVVRHHDRTGNFLEKLNAALREGKYSTDIWTELTGKSEAELEQLWRSQGE